MEVPKIGVASAAAYKARTMAIARGGLVPALGAPKLWFTSEESAARLGSDAAYQSAHRTNGNAAR
jgi:predicted transcriptional regulator